MNNQRLQYNSIKLRPLEPEDLELLYLWENDPSLWQVSNTFAPFSRFILKQYLEESHRDIYEAKQLRLVIENTDQKAVGAIDLFDFDPYHQRAGVGILIYGKEDRQHGYATDTLQVLCKYARETLGLHQLYANIAANNAGSIRLFEKCGFAQCGIKKDWLKVSSGYLDELILQKLL